MHDIWNPWHGCKKKSEGCQNCYMYFLDSQRGKTGGDIYRVKNNFNYPIQKDKNGKYKIKSGEYLRVCMTSDFFLEEADEWRDEAWDIIKQRQDIVFIFVTKRPERVLKCLRQDIPLDNIWFHVTCENQERADERIPILLDLPFVHKGVMVAPFVGKVSIAQYLATGQIENVWAGGENYDGARPLFYSWVKLLSDECKNFDVSFSFFETGNVFIKDNKKIVFKDKIEQTKFAYLEDLNYESSKQQKFNLLKSSENTQLGLFEQEHPTPFYKPHCQYCLQKKWCVGCSNCGKCSCS
jgi:protein gp37